MNDLEDFGGSVNGVVSDEAIEDVLSGLEEKPQLIKILTSKSQDDLKMLSEIPRRLVFLLVNVDVIVESRRRLIKYLYGKGRTELATAMQQMMVEEAGLLETWLRSFLLYMRGVDRKFIGEILEAYIAASAQEEGEEIDATAT